MKEKDKGEDEGRKRMAKSLIQDGKEKLQLLRDTIEKKNKKMGKKIEGNRQWK